TSVTTLLVIAVAKTLAYAVSLGGGFRGGMVFPAVYLGTVVGVATPLLVSGTTSSPLVAAGIAAAVAGVLRLPFTGVLLALLLCAAAGLTVTTSAIIGSVIGVLVRVAADMRLKRTDPQPATEPA
ncbi:MAG: chloride channel protein, partial [Candidatus Nanopelagicales bacterium]